MIIIPAPMQYPRKAYPYTNITPFTYRDGLTFAESLESLKAYIRDTLAPWLEENVQGLADNWEEQVTNLISAVDNALAAQTENVNDSIGELKTFVNDSIQQIINNSIEVVDPVIAQTINDSLSETSAALQDYLESVVNDDENAVILKLNSKYADIDVQETVETGRLSESYLDLNYASKNIEDEIEIGRLSEPSLLGLIVNNAIPINIVKPGINNVVGDGVTDDSGAIQEIINQSDVGSTIFFDKSGTYYISNTLIIDKYLHFMWPGYTRYYGGYIVVAPAITGIRVNTGMVSFTNVCMKGNGAELGIGATNTAIDFWGTPQGDVDGRVSGGNFYGFANCIKTRGRNLFVTDTIFSNSIIGIFSMGMDDEAGGYHETRQSSIIRGIRIERNRFHGIGYSGATDSTAIKLDNHKNFFHGKISDNYSDAGPYGYFIRSRGTSAYPIVGLDITNNMIAEQRTTAIELYYNNEFNLVGNYVYGAGGVLVDKNTIDVVSSSKGSIISTHICRAGAVGLRIQTSSRILISDIKIQDAGKVSASDGMLVASDSSNILINNLFVDGATNYGFRGSPTQSKLGERMFINCLSGEISSTTIT